MNDPLAAPPLRSKPWEWLLCALLLLATLLNYADRQALPVTAVRVKTELKLTNEQYGQIEGIFGLAFGIGAMLGGVAADRINVRWLYPSLMVIWSCAGIVTGWAETFASLYLSRLALGLFEAGHWPCALRTVQRTFPPARRTLANSILQAGAPLGAIVPSLLMLGIITKSPGSWRQIFWFIGILGVPWAWLWLRAVRSSDLKRPVLQTAETTLEGHAPLQEIPFLKVLCSRRYWILMAVIVCINTCWHYIRVWMPPVLQENLGYSEEQVQRFFIPYWLATFAGSLVSGWLSRISSASGLAVHRSRITIWLVFSLMTSLTTVAAFLPAGTLFFALMFLIGFGCLGLFPIYYSLNQELSGANQGKVSGSLSFATWFVLYWLHPLIGWLRDHVQGTEPFILAAVGLLPLAAWFLIAALWRSPSGLAPPTPRLL